ncbi:MAG: cobalamin-dependent protein [Clostridiales Family XIII bacterium]|jgi:methanogenic corrinoid protein MtbC1|nr:cobalamin-dependent protein [Clostridiales Family XIII bacterium]
MKKYIEELMPFMENRDFKGAIAVVEKAIAEGISPIGFLQEVLVPVMDGIGDRFSKMELFLPDLMSAAEVAAKIKDELSDRLVADSGAAVSKQGKIVIGTVKGDVHDIGESMVVTILEIYGFEVTDLGNDVSTFDFIDTAERLDADIIAMSSLLTTSMPYMEELVETLVALKKRDKFKVVVGGGPVSQEFADQIGADGYGHDAAEAAGIFRDLLA